MKKIIFQLLLFISAHALFSQDLIVTLTNDSLNCQITQIESELIHFNYVYNKEVRNTVLMLDAIRMYQKNYYSKGKSRSQNNAIKDYPKLNLMVSGGGSYLLDPIPQEANEQVKNYYKNLKLGFNVGFDVNYYFNKTVGAGLKYSYFNSSNSASGSYSSGDGINTEWSFSENKTINFAGPTFLMRFLSKRNNNAFITGLSIGYMWYEDDAILLNPIVFTGNTFGLNIDVGYHISLSKSLFLGFSVSTTLGFLSSITVDDGDSIRTFDYESFSDYDNISRADISIKLGFKK